MSDDGRMLDPTDWEAVRSVGHRMVDTAPRWPARRPGAAGLAPIPDGGEGALPAPPPAGASTPEAVYSEFPSSGLPVHRLGNVHPRFFARVMGTGNADGALAELAAAAMNNNLSGLESSAVHVEAPGAALAEGAARLPGDGERAAHQWLQHGEPDRAPGGARRPEGGRR